MCGIIGIINNSNAGKNVIEGLNSINYRGKDGSAFTDGKTIIQNKKLEGKSFIGHCLHAVVNHIIQPIKGKGIIAANSEIYNWKELA